MIKWRKAAAFAVAMLTLSSLAVATSTSSASALAVGTGSITGLVTGPTGAPAPFVSVTVYQFDGTTWVRGIGTFTGFDGTYAIGSLPDGVPLELSYASFFDQSLATQWFDHADSQAAATAITLAPGESRPIDVQLAKAAVVSGTLTAADGTPLNGSVTLFDPATGVSSFTGVFGGTYSAFVSPGNYVVYAQPDIFPTSDLAPEYYGQSFSIDTATRVPVTAGAQITGIDVTLSPGAVIIARMLDANNQPIQGSALQAVTGNGPPNTFFQTGAGADSSGVVTLVGVPTGTFTYFAFGVGLFMGRNVDITTTVGMTINVDIHLDKGYFGLMTLHNAAGVVSSNVGFGSSISVCAVTAASPASGCGNGFVAVQAQPNPDGGDSWLVGPLTPGDYVAIPSDTRIGGLGQGTPVPFTVLPGQTVSCDLSLPDLATPSTCQPAPLLPTGTISGRVVGPDGLGLAGVQVDAVYGGSRTLQTSVFTDANGDYLMEGVAPSSYRIRFTPPFDRTDLGPSYWSTTGSVPTQAQGGLVTVTAGSVTSGIDGQISKVATGTFSITTNGAPNPFSPSTPLFCRAPATPLIGLCSDGTPPIGSNPGFTAASVSIPAGTWTTALETFAFPAFKLGSVTTFTVQGGDAFTCSLDTETTGPSSCTVAGSTPPDTTPPVITPSVSPTTPDGNNGWYRSDVSVHFQVEEPESPASLTTTGCADVSVTADQPATTYSCTASSAGGNAGPVAVTIQRDSTAPTVSWNSSIADGSSFVFGSVPAAPTCAAVDALSGPNDCTVQGYSTAVGTHTLVATATDLAGNMGSASITYTVTPYRLVGFRAPVRPAPLVNFLDAGEDVRFQWKVFAGATELTSATAMSSLTATPASCLGFVPSGAAVDLTVGNPVTRDLKRGVFSLKWEPTRRQRGCWVVTMTTADGSSLSARFRIK